MLTDRQKIILKMIIDDYVRFAEPVGSRVIAKKEIVKFSSATIRNEMADLEELGYLVQPHTSAGRIPSQKGYRYYVDYLMESTKLSEKEIYSIKNILFQKKMQVEEVISKTATILADFTNYTAIALGPEVYQTIVKNIQLIPINNSNCVCLLVTDTGHIEKKVITIPPELPIHELERMTNILNAKLSGTPLYKLPNVLYSELSTEVMKNTNYFEQAIEFLEGLVAFDDHNDNRGIFLKGTSHILNQPEFKDLDKVKTFLGLFEHNGLVLDLFANQSSKTEVKIGKENQIIEAQDCSIITANYIVNGRAIGSIGIIGPTRLDYAKVISLIEHVSSDLSKIFNSLYAE